MKAKSRSKKLCPDAWLTYGICGKTDWSYKPQGKGECRVLVKDGIGAKAFLKSKSKDTGEGVTTSK